MGERPETTTKQTPSAVRQLRTDPVSWLREWIRRRFVVDTRALAALRILLGTILVIDLVHRSFYLDVFYTDDGMYPRSAHEAMWGSFPGYSLHGLFGDVWVQGLLFLIAAGFAIAVLVGYRTRLAALLSLVFLISLQARNPAVLNGGDRLLRVILFVAVLTPLGERWSIDAIRRGSARRSVASIATAALLIQPIAVFTSNAAQKHAGTTWYNGDGLQIALSNDVMTVFLGSYLVEYPVLLEALNWMWIGLLVGSPLFLLLTTGRLRALFAVIYAGAFIGMFLTLAVGLFPFVLVASVIPFLTAPFWDAAARRIPPRIHEALPTARAGGPLAQPPIERRLLTWLRTTNQSLAEFIVEYGRSLGTVVAVLVLIWIVLFTTASVTVIEVPDEIDYSALDQQDWGLYAPNPSEAYSWYVVEAELADGTLVDAFSNTTVTFDRPPDPSAEYPTFRHRKFMETVQYSGQSDTSDAVAEAYASWTCRQATQIHDVAVEHITVHQVIQTSPIDGEYDEPWNRTVIEQPCSA